jgi:CII-binding regulator of phage lambda lysogenization HflD
VQNNKNQELQQAHASVARLERALEESKEHDAATQDKIRRIQTDLQTTEMLRKELEQATGALSSLENKARVCEASREAGTGGAEALQRAVELADRQRVRAHGI